MRQLKIPETNKQASHSHADRNANCCFLGLCCALFCPEAVVNPKSGSRGMEFQDHVSRASKFLHSKPSGQNFSHLTHRFLHLPTSATDFSFDVPPLFLSVFKDEAVS
jgi:hypothetical protein